MLLLVAVLLISAASCDKKDSSVGLQDYGFLGGTDGISISFVEGNPPDRIFDHDPFLVSVELENLGETEVKEGQVISTLEGISYRSYAITQPTLTNEIPIERVRFDRQTGNQIVGGVEQINYEAEFIDDLDFEATHTMSVNVCYLYQTRAVSSLCLVHNPTQRPGENDVCMVSEAKGVGNSGAPVQVTQLSERASGKTEVSFNFQIENNGMGKVYHPSFAEKVDPKCSDAGNEQYLDRVQVTVMPPENLPLRCPKLDEGLNTGTVRLIKGGTTVVCAVDTNELTQTVPFPGEVKVQVDYIYKEHISTQITVENVG